MVAQDEKQRHLGLDIDPAPAAVHGQFEHRHLLGTDGKEIMRRNARSLHVAANDDYARNAAARY